MTFEQSKKAVLDELKRQDLKRRYEEYRAQNRRLGGKITDGSWRYISLDPDDPIKSHSSHDLHPD